MHARNSLVAALMLGTSLIAGLAACTDTDPVTPEPTPTTTPTVVVDLSVGVFGTPGELDAYRDVIEDYDARTDEVNVELETYGSEDALLAALKAGEVPDVFMVDRSDLSYLLEAKLTQPIGERLDERNVDFGDDYSRAALEAFSVDRKLQCMPYGISPMVVYYNKALVDFDRMRLRELNVPNLDPDSRLRWSFEQFRVAAEFATRPRRDSKGFFVPPTLQGITPFLISGGGSVFDNEVEPTSLAFSSDGSRSALATVLPVLRDPGLTLTSAQLEERSAVAWFERDKLGMIVADRSLTARLRKVPALDFGVMPMPTLNETTTVGQITGMCISADTPEVAESADLLVDFVSTEAVQRVVPVGNLVPANQTVALTDDFLQPTRLPERADVFNEGVSKLYIPPLVEDEMAITDIANAGIRDLLQVEIPDIEALTEQIDEASRAILLPFDPEPTSTASPSASPSG